MADRNPLERDTSASGDGVEPPRRTGFQQAEVFGGPESYGSRSEPVSGGGGGGRSLLPLFLAGAGMVAITVLARVFGAPGLLAAGLGIGGFLIALVLMRRPARPPERVIAEVEGVDVQAVRAALDTAEAELLEIDRLAHGLLDRGLRAPLSDMTASARAVLEAIAADPGDLRRSRKYVKVYIPSARAAVEKYAGLGVVDAELGARFRALVTEMTETGRRQLETLRLDDKTSLEVEMDVLVERLKAGRSNGDG